MISGFQTVLKNAMDVIAPPATPLQDFTYHWKQIMHFYVNDFSNSKVSIELTSIPRHLDKLLNLLLEEEQETNDPGPCLEYLLQHRLLDLIATLASAETPPGMRLVCLYFLRRLLTRSKHPLLHHASVYGPIQRLIVLCNGYLASPIENEEIQFLISLCFLVSKYPHVTNVVNDSSKIAQENEERFCDQEKSEMENVTYLPARKVSNVNTLFKPLNAQAVTLLNPDLFKNGCQLSSSESEKLNKRLEELRNFKLSKNTDLCQTTNSSAQSTSSSKDVENISLSSSPYISSILDNNIPTKDSKVPQSFKTQIIDPIISTNNCFKNLNLESNYSPMISKNSLDRNKDDINLSNLDSPAVSKCLLLDALKTYINSADNKIRIRACEGIMVLASLDDPVFSEVVAKSDLANVIAKRLGLLFNSIPAHVEPSEIEDLQVSWGLDSPPLESEQKFPGCRKVAAFFMWLDFCNQLTKEAHPDVAEVIAKIIRVGFFEKVLSPALAAHHAVLITALVAKCMRQLTSTALNLELNTWLVGGSEGPTSADMWSWPVLHRFVENCRSNNEDLVVETLKLFEEMIDRRDAHILHCLVLVYLNGRGYYDNGAADSAIASWSDEEDEREREKKGTLNLADGMAHSRTLAPNNIHRILNCFLSIVPRQLQTESEDSYGRSIDDWEKQYSVVVKDCALLAWPLEAVSVVPDDSTSFDSRQEIDSCINKFYMGPFLSVLLEKVINIPKQRYNINLQLSILISKLALLPHPYLHEFLLNPLIPLLPGHKNLFMCLQKVVKYLISEVVKVKDYKEILKETRLRLCDECSYHNFPLSKENSSRDKSEEILFQSVIITEEFCKELAAIAYVKYHRST